MPTPCISIIIPVYKTEIFLEKCVCSVLNGTMSNIEVIIVNDGSPDGEQCDKYAINDMRVSVIHQHNAGVSAARNVGIANATGQYVAFVDSDDWVHPCMFQEMYRLAADNDADIVSCGYAEVFVTQDVTISNRIEQSKIVSMDNYEVIRQFLLSAPEACSNVWNKIYARSLFTDDCFPEGRTLGEDASATYKLYHKSKKVIHTPTVFYFYVFHRESVTKKTFMPSVMDALITADEIIEHVKAAYPSLLLHSESFRLIVALRIAAYFDKYTQKLYPTEYLKVKSILSFSTRPVMALLPRRHRILLLLFKYCHPVFIAVWQKRLKTK